MHFVSLFFLNERNITISLFMTHLKGTVEFRFLIYVYFNETFVKNFMKKTLSFEYKFPKFISRCSILQNIRMSNLVILKRRPFEYKVKFEKRPLLFRSEIGIFDIFLKRMYEESFEDLQINSN